MSSPARSGRRDDRLGSGAHANPAPVVERWLNLSPKASVIAGSLLAAFLLIVFEFLPEPPGVPRQEVAVSRLFSLLVGVYLALAPISVSGARRDILALELPRVRLDGIDQWR